MGVNSFLHFELSGCNLAPVPKNNKFIFSNDSLQQTGEQPSLQSISPNTCGLLQRNEKWIRIVSKTRPQTNWSTGVEPVGDHHREIVVLKRLKISKRSKPLDEAGLSGENWSQLRKWPHEAEGAAYLRWEKMISPIDSHTWAAGDRFSSRLKRVQLRSERRFLHKWEEETFNSPEVHGFRSRLFSLSKLDGNSFWCIITIQCVISSIWTKLR